MASSSLAATSIALTTTFTPSPSCLSDYYQIEVGWLSLGPPSTSACLPSGWEVTSQYFSPGVCPSGYEIACSTLVSVGSLTETQATCCPSGYSCQTNRDSYWYSTEPCTATASKLPSVVTATSSNNSITSIYPLTICSGCGANAYGVSIRWQASDFVTTTSTSATSTRTSTTSTPSSMSNSTSNNNDLTAGAKAGIGIGVTVLVLAIVAVIACFAFQRRKRIRAQSQGAIQTSPMKGPELKELGNTQPLHELDTGMYPHHELYGGEGRREGSISVYNEAGAPGELHGHDVGKHPAN